MPGKARTFDGVGLMRVLWPEIAVASIPAAVRQFRRRAEADPDKHQRTELGLRRSYAGGHGFDVALATRY